MLRPAHVVAFGALALLACKTTNTPKVQGELNWTIPPNVPVAGGADAGTPAGPPKLVFAGNRVLPNSVYESVLNLGTGWVADADTAAMVQRKIVKFLRESGYELANVHVIAHDNQIDIGINEGRLEKIVFRGRLSVQSLQFTFALELPHEVFNRPELERQTKILEEKLGIGHIWFVLVPTVQLTHLGPQLEKLPEIRGFELLHEREPWELHFFFTEREWGNGFGIDLRSSYLDGLEFGVNVMRESLIFDGDRTRVAAGIGFGLRNRITDGGIYPFFSRSAFDARWYSAPVVADVRVSLIARGDVIARQLIDKLVLLENYWCTTDWLSVNLSATIQKGFTFSAGMGLNYRRIWGLQLSPAAPLEVPPPSVHFTEDVRPFFEGKFDLVFDPNNNRTDRWHLFAGEAIAFAPPTVLRNGIAPWASGSAPWAGMVHFHYQNPIQFGWHDLWVRARGRTLFGEKAVSFHDEDSVAEYNHGIFGDKNIRRGVSTEVEFRFSITRDLFKISVFHSIFAFGEVTDRGGFRRVNGQNVPEVRYEETPRIGTAIGPGFHALIQGMFQLDIYGSFGILNNGRTAYNATLILNKVF